MSAAAASVLAGGVLAVLFVLARRTGPRLLNNLRTSLQLGFVRALSGSAPSFRIEPGVSAGKLPYGVAIAAGTIAHLVLHQLAFI